MANLIQIVIDSVGNAESKIDRVAGSVSGLSVGLGALVGSAAGPALAQIAAGVTDVANAFILAGPHISDEVEQLQNLSVRTGANVNQLRVLRQVMEEAGQSPDALTNSLTILNRNLANGKKELIALVGSTRDPMEALLKLSDVVEHGGNAAKIAFDAMGRGGGELAPILADLDERFADVRERLGELSPATIAAAEAWDKMMDHLKTATKSALAEIGGGMLTMFQKPMLLAQMMMSMPGLRNLGAASMGISVDEWVDQMHALSAELLKVDEQKKKAIVVPSDDPLTVDGGGLLKDMLRTGGSRNPFAPVTLTKEQAQFGEAENFESVFGTPDELRERQDALDQMVLSMALAVDKGKSVSTTFDEWDAALETLREDAVLGAGLAIADAIDGWAFRGENAAEAVKSAFLSAFRDIANSAVQFGLGSLMKMAGNALTLSGNPFGPALSYAGGRMAGPQGMVVNNFNALDTKTLREQVQHGGALARAQEQAAIGRDY